MTETSLLSEALTKLLSELVDGAPSDAYVLNPNDPGILRSLDRLTAAQASQLPAGGGASIAAHIDHLCYGFDLMNRYASGDEHAFDDADYSKSWERGTVDDEQWRALRDRLGNEVRRWRVAMPSLDQSVPLHLLGCISSIVHLAYHLGAIRQIDRALAGPPAA